MKKIFLSSFLLVSVFLVASAHDVLKNLKPDLLKQVQQNLIDNGYLDAKKVKLGVYDEQTDEAFDKYQEDRERAYLESQNATTSVEADATETQKVSFWEGIIHFFRNLFQI